MHSTITADKGVTLATPKKIMIVAGKADAMAAQRMMVHLNPLVREGLVTFWHDSNLMPGDCWDTVQPQRVAQADMVAVLCSNRAYEDHYFEELLGIAFARRRAGEPIVLVPVYLDWDAAPFGLRGTQWLPQGEVINDRQDSESGWVEVAQGFRKLLNADPHGLPRRS